MSGVLNTIGLIVIGTAVLGFLPALYLYLEVYKPALSKAYYEGVHAGKTEILGEGWVTRGVFDKQKWEVVWSDRDPGDARKVLEEYGASANTLD